MMKNYFFILLTFVMSFYVSAQVDVTFRVDMGSATINSNGIHVVGSFNGWDTTANPLTLESGTIYTTTVSNVSENQWIEYKFLNGNDFADEETAAGVPCSGTNGNRYIYVNGSGVNLDLVTVPFGGCNATGTSMEINFNVDMTSSPTTFGDEVYLAGAYNGWNSSIFPMNFVSDQDWEVTLRLPTSTTYQVEMEYKYVKNTTEWENPADPSGCSTTGDDGGGNINRFWTATTTSTELLDIFNGCSNTVLSTEDITFNALKFIYSKNERSLNILNTNSNNLINKIQIFSATGQIVKTITKTNLSNKINIDFTANADGLYFVKVSNQGKQFVKKLMVY